MDLSDITATRRELCLPPLLISLMEAGKWVHPGDEVLRRCVPFIEDPLSVLGSFEAMLLNSGPLMGDGVTEDEIFSEYRGSVVPPRELPWIDVEKTILIMCNERPGDDVCIALDYRPATQNPRVIGSDWNSNKQGVIYRKVADTFDEFAGMLGLV